MYASFSSNSRNLPNSRFPFDAVNFRLAFYSTEVSWKKEFEPFNDYQQKRFKFLNPTGVDHSKFGKDIPDYRK